MSLLSGNAGAQQTAQGSTETDQEDPVSGAMAQIGNGVRLLDYSTEEIEQSERSRMLLKIDADSPTPIQMADAFGPFAESGVSEIETRTLAVESGESTLKIDCTEVRGQVGVSVATPDSFGIAVSTGLSQPSTDSLSIGEGVAYGTLTGIAGTGIAAWRKSRSDLDEPEEAEFDEGGLLDG